MRNVTISLLFLLACRTTPTGTPDTTLWPDFECAWPSMYAATLETYSATTTDAVFLGTNLSVEIGKPAAGLTWTDGRVWVRRAEERTLDSTLAHEMWEHRLPYELIGDSNPYHTLRWWENRHRLHSRAWVLTVECLTWLKNSKVEN